MTITQPDAQATAPAVALRNGLGTAALTLGIIGAVFAFVPFMWWLGFILGILAAVFGFVGRRRVKTGQASNGGAALSGIVTGIAAIVISTAMFVMFIAAVGSAADSIDRSLDNTTTHGSVASNGAVSSEQDQDYRFSHLRVSPDQDFGLETFKGSIVVRNTTGHQADVFVSVDAFNHNQNVGELNGQATLKPHSVSRVELTSLDDFVKATDYKVEVSGF